MAKISIFLFGVLSYLVFFVVFLYGIGFIGGFFTPTSLDGVPRVPASEAILIDLALLLGFAVQHSGMARSGFKRWWTKFVPPAAERSAYVLLSSLALVALFALWEPVGGDVWVAPEGLARQSVIALYLVGWLLLLYATFLIDHFDLFGLKQVWSRLKGQPWSDPKFHTPSLYGVVRHPLYVGWLIIFWAAPTMTASHLVFAVCTTAYILVAIQFEERDLLARFGEDYANYQRRVPMLVPKFRRRPEYGLSRQSEDSA